MQTFVVYDISDNKRRKNLSILLESYGLSRVQYSAFKGELDLNDREVLARKAAGFVEEKSDSVYIIPVFERCIQNVELIGDSKASSINESRVHIV